LIKKIDLVGQSFLQLGKPRVGFLRELGAALILILSILCYAYFSGKLLDFFYTEDFLLFHYANNFSYLEAIKLYVSGFGRPFEAAYWAGIYKIFAYDPAKLHFLSFLLHLSGVILASLILYRIWPRKSSYSGAFLVFVIVLFFNPLATNWGAILSGDNTRLSILFFMVSILCIQEWARTEFRAFWLVSGILVFLVSIFTYDVTIFLFPASLLLAWPLMPAGKRFEEAKKKILWFGTASIFLGLIPFTFYQLLESSSVGGIRHPAFDHPFRQEIPARLLQAAYNILPTLYKIGNNLFIHGSLSTLIIFIPFAAIVVGSIWNLIRIKSKNNFNTFIQQNKVLIGIFGASLWIIVMSVLPYLLAYPNGYPQVRYYSAAIYGFSFLLFSIFSVARGYLVRAAISLLVPVIIIAGIAEYNLVTGRLREEDKSNFYLSLVEIVPAVRERTVIFIIDPEVDLSPSVECTMGLEMLYDVKDLRCGFLSFTNQSYEARREDNFILAYSGVWSDSENWIFITVNEDGTKAIVPEITSADGLLINWIYTQPIYTDKNRILFDQKPDSRMYLYLITREENIIN